MRQFTIVAAAGSILLGSLGAWGADVDPLSLEAKLDKLSATRILLTPPANLKGDFTVAKTAPDVEIVSFPGQTAGSKLWSSWGDAVFASDGNFYTSVGDHDAPHGTAYVFRVDPREGTVRLVVDYNRAIGAKDPDAYTPGKIHGNLVDGGDGWLYFIGYRGSEGKTSEKEGYKGDWLVRYHFATGKTENFGIAVPNCSVPVLLFDTGSRSLMGLGAPGRSAGTKIDRFFRYSVDEKKLVVNGGGPDPNIARAMAGTDGGLFVRSDPKSNELATTKTRVPGNGQLRAASEPDKNGLAWCITQDGILFSFDTKSEAITEHGDCFVAPPLYTATCKLDPSGRYLYYLPGAHGRSSQLGTPIVQYDTQSKTRKVIAFLSAAVLEERKHNLGGTYGIALNDDGSKLFVNFNGGALGAKQPDFGDCAAVVVTIPASERKP